MTRQFYVYPRNLQELAEAGAGPAERIFIPITLKLDFSKDALVAVGGGHERADDAAALQAVSAPGRGFVRKAAGFSLWLARHDLGRAAFLGVETRFGKFRQRQRHE